MVRTTFLVLASWLLLGCGERTAPPSAGPRPSAVHTTPAVATLMPTAVAPPAPAPPPAPPPASTLADAGAAGAKVEEAVDPVPPLVDGSGAPLPQTDQRPPTRSPSFERRIALLCEAIRTDDPKKAEPAFFPVLAYQQVKDVKSPERDWKYRLWKAFERNIHDYHRTLGRDAEQAHCEGIDIPEDRAKFMKPATEGNRLGYYRVLRSALRVLDAQGKPRRLEVTSMISWRGEWYVVHLNGFE